MTSFMNPRKIFSRKYLRLPQCLITLKHRYDVRHVVSVYFSLAVAQESRYEIFDQLVLLSN